MKKVISMIQKKGGSAKTTTAVHLAAALSGLFPNLKIAVADADPQQSASIWIRRSHGAIGVSVHQVGADGEGRNMRDEIDAINADVVIIDTPPSLESITLRAALRSNLMLVPTSPSIVDLSATKEAVKTCKEVIELNPDKKYLLIPSRVQHNTASGRELRGILEAWGHVSEATI